MINAPLNFYTHRSSHAGNKTDETCSVNVEYSDLTPSIQLWPKLLDKWVKAGAEHTAFNEANPLGQWHQRIEGIYEIKLSLPQKK